MVKNLPANAGDAREVGLIPGSGRSHSSILAWEIPGTEQPGGLRSMESLREGPDLATEHASTVLTSGGKRGPFLEHYPSSSHTHIDSMNQKSWKSPGSY